MPHGLEAGDPVLGLPVNRKPGMYRKFGVSGCECYCVWACMKSPLFYDHGDRIGQRDGLRQKPLGSRRQSIVHEVDWT